MRYEVWCEAAGPSTGTEGRNTFEAHLVAVVEAADWDDAVRKAYNGRKDDSYVYRQTNGTWSYWGCRLWDNEADARIAFSGRATDKRPSAKEE